jgi:hypothetical protein
MKTCLLDVGDGVVVVGGEGVVVVVGGEGVVICISQNSPVKPAIQL